MIYALTAAIALLQIADAVFTVRILKNGGRELNPVMAWLFGRLGMVPALAATKAAFVVALFFLAPYAPVAAYAVIAILYAGIVAWNWRQYAKQR